MQKKLTLSIDEELIKFAHNLSKRINKPISKIFEEYLYQLMRQNQRDEIHPKTAGLYGVLKDNPVPDKEELRNLFHDKNNN